MNAQVEGFSCANQTVVGYRVGLDGLGPFIFLISIFHAQKHNARTVSEGRNPLGIAVHLSNITS